MDNVTHSLVGLALSRAGFNRLAPHTTTLLLLAANAPDADIVYSAGGALSYFEHHRGYTHSIVALPVMAALCVLVTAAIFRTRLPWLRMWLIAVAGVGSHLLLDWTNSYGIRLLLPFSSRWFHADLSFVYDWALFAVLIPLALWPWFSSLISREIGERPARGRGSAIASLVFYLLFEIFRAVLHSQAQGQLSARIYNGAAPVRTAALPSVANPFAWTGIVETPDAYRRFDMNDLENLDVERGSVFYKPHPDIAIHSATQTEPFRYLMYFARFPVWSEEPVTLGDGHATRVDLTDLRFGEPDAGSFHAVALIEVHGRILDSLFTFGSGAQQGFGR